MAVEEPLSPPRVAKGQRQERRAVSLVQPKTSPGLLGISTVTPGWICP